MTILARSSEGCAAAGPANVYALLIARVLQMRTSAPAAGLVRLRLLWQCREPAGDA